MCCGVVTSTKQPAEEGTGNKKKEIRRCRSGSSRKTATKNTLAPRRRLELRFYNHSFLVAEE